MLVLFALCIVAPATVVLGAMVAWNVEEVRRSQEAELLATARSASRIVDLRMAELAVVANALATSDNVIAADWEGARQRIRRLNLPQSAWVAVSDRDGRRLLNTSPEAPASTPPRLPRPANVEAATRSDQPLFSDLFTGASTGRKVVAVDRGVPGSPTGVVVSVVTDPEHLLPRRSELAIPPDAFVTLVDGNNRVAARSRQHQRFQGVSATPNMIAAMAANPDGVVHSRSLEGEPTAVGYARSELTGWTTMVVVPQATLLSPLWRNGAAFAFLAAVLLLLGAGLSRIFGNAIIRELHALEHDAEVLGHGGDVAPRSGQITNVNRVQSALSAAAAELRLRSERQQLMINELNHRVKNTLATVQGIAVQTFRKADPEAPAKFDARLGALAAGHDLLTQTSWEAVDIQAVVERCGSAAGENMVAVGPSRLLPPQAALALCMCLHELITNSLKYGALAVPNGKVFVSWTVDERSAIDFQWREQDGPVVQAPAAGGFGTRLVDRLIRSELGGDIERRFEPTGLVVSARLAPPDGERWRNRFD